MHLFIEKGLHFGILEQKVIEHPPRSDLAKSDCSYSSTPIDLAMSDFWAFFSKKSYLEVVFLFEDFVDESIKSYL